MYALVFSGAVIDANLSLNVWRDQHPQVSLPFVPSEVQLNEVGIYTVELTPQPPIDHTQNAESSVVFDGTSCAQEWSVSPASEDEITLRTAKQAETVREQRNKKLADSDWTQLSDAPVDQGAWTIYRQELRDITGQDGFPWAITWPETP
jgi:hypothetical protein